MYIIGISSRYINLFSSQTVYHMYRKHNLKSKVHNPVAHN